MNILFIKERTNVDKNKWVLTQDYLKETKKRQKLKH